MLTQSPTIQRINQRIIVALAPSLKSKGINLHLRNITQAYVQLVTLLARVIFARPPKEITYELLLGIIFKVIKPFYRVPEAGIY